MDTIEFVAEEAGTRLDKLLVAHFGDHLSRAQVQQYIKDGLVTVDGLLAKPSMKLKGAERIVIQLPDIKENESVEAEEIPLDVLYEDDWLAVINKAAGMIVHPGVGNETGTLVAAALARWPEIALMENKQRMGIVHRLDKDTSGLIVIAKSDLSRRRLMAQFQERTVDKTYLALCERMPKTGTGRIDIPIARDPKNRKRMWAKAKGKPAVTEFTVIENGFRDGQALLEVKLLTGRTHQIRVHLAYIGCPLVGDPVYGYRKQRIRLKRQFLHAAKLAFDHPDTGERMSFEAELPVSLQDILRKLR